MTRRIWCVFLALCVLLLLGGCGEVPGMPDDTTDLVGDDTTATTDEEMVFALPYSHDDTLNPFTATTKVNVQLTHLLYDSLTAVGDGYVPQLSLASEVVVTDATHLTATLREGAVFSDGSAVTPDDVVRSFQQAQASANYKTLLSNVTAAKADKKKRQITFTLATPDIHADACLTFPVMKASTLTDKAAKAPIGGGLYTVASADGGLKLTKNPHHPTEVNYAEIALQHLPNTAARYYALASGKLAYYFDDLSEGEIPRITGASRPVSLNTMVFLGINSAHKQLAIPEVRQALHLLLDRAAMASVYADYGTSATTLFPSAWAPMAEISGFAWGQDTDGALTLLEQADYPLTGKKMPELRR